MKVRKANFAQTSKKKVLLVDDHPLVRTGLAQVINQQEDLVVCCEASDAREAMQHLETGRPDLAVVDISLEGKSGLELLKDIRALHPDVPVLVMSMHDETLYAERVLRAGGRGYVMKRAGGEVVLEAMRRVLDGQVYVSPAMSARILDLFSGRRAHNSPIAKLTDREFEVFQLIGQGKTTRAIAQQLHLSVKTVDVHRGHIKAKLELPDATSLVRHAVRWVESQHAGAGSPGRFDPQRARASAARRPV
jgi:DNA-binding NarL/FixJ family response regulator